jgi:hypothetical protein
VVVIICDLKEYQLLTGHLAKNLIALKFIVTKREPKIASPRYLQGRLKNNSGVNIHREPF